ncbi:Solute carrier family 23 member 2, partial [Lamellibrachia satsuma]
RSLQLQGCLTVAALFEVFIGLFGVVGFFMRFIGPITVAPTIILIGMSMARVTADLCSKQWWIALMTTFLLGLFSQYLVKVSIPCAAKCQPDIKNKKHTRVFQLYAVLLTVAISVAVCAILTVTDVLSSAPGSWGYEARTDTRIKSVYEARWFQFPYPGQFGRMRFNVAGVIGMMMGILASVLESVGDYHACARISGAPPPPIHAINRGIFLEGVGCVISGLLGTGVGSTSYSDNIAAIGITKIGSRRVIQVGACIMVFMGMFGKFGALVGIIPSPVV